MVSDSDPTCLNALENGPTQPEKSTEVIFVHDNDALKIVPQRVRPRKSKMSPEELVADLSYEELQTLREADQPFQQLNRQEGRIFNGMDAQKGVKSG